MTNHWARTFSLIEKSSCFLFAFNNLLRNKITTEVQDLNVNYIIKAPKNIINRFDYMVGRKGKKMLYNIATSQIIQPNLLYTMTNSVIM